MSRCQFSWLVYCSPQVVSEAWLGPINFLAGLIFMEITAIVVLVVAMGDVLEPTQHQPVKLES